MVHIVFLQVWSDDKKHSIRKEFHVTNWFELHGHYKQMIEDLKKITGKN